MSYVGLFFFFGLCHVLSTCFVICAYLKYLRGVPPHAPPFMLDNSREEEPEMVFKPEKVRGRHLLKIVRLLMGQS